MGDETRTSSANRVSIDPTAVLKAGREQVVSDGTPAGYGKHEGNTNSNIDTNETQSDNKQDGEAQGLSNGRSWRFWAIIPSLMFTTLLSAVEVTGMCRHSVLSFIETS